MTDAEPRQRYPDPERDASESNVSDPPRFHASVGRFGADVDSVWSMDDRTPTGRGYRFMPLTMDMGAPSSSITEALVVEPGTRRCRGRRVVVLPVPPDGPSVARNCTVFFAAGVSVEFVSGVDDPVGRDTDADSTARSTAVKVSALTAVRSATVSRLNNQSRRTRTTMPRTIDGGANGGAFARPCAPDAPTPNAKITRCVICCSRVVFSSSNLMFLPARTIIYAPSIMQPRPMPPSIGCFGTGAARRAAAERRPGQQALQHSVWWTLFLTSRRISRRATCAEPVATTGGLPIRFWGIVAAGLCSAFFWETVLEAFQWIQAISFDCHTDSLFV